MFKLLFFVITSACLWSRDEGIYKLTPFGNKLPPSVGPAENITIAPRLYCTALRFCNYHNDDMAHYSDRCYVYEVQRRYLIVDVGKSTVDITALVHTPTDSCYEFVVPTVTHAVGGMQVNENFLKFLQVKFLQELVNDREFSHFVSKSNDEYHHLVLTHMIKYVFENIKVDFGMQIGFKQAHTQKSFKIIWLLKVDFFDSIQNDIF